MFQHTAARRRLAAKRAARKRKASFNTQPPEGGWAKGINDYAIGKVSTHSRPKAAVAYIIPYEKRKEFQHTAARRRLLSSAMIA